MQRIKGRINVLPSTPTPGTVNPLLSSDLCGIKTSIALLNITVCWILNTWMCSKVQKSKLCHLKFFFFCQITRPTEAQGLGGFFLFSFSTATIQVHLLKKKLCCICVHQLFQMEREGKVSAFSPDFVSACVSTYIENEIANDLNSYLQVV